MAELASQSNPNCRWGSGQDAGEIHALIPTANAPSQAHTLKNSESSIERCYHPDEQDYAGPMGSHERGDLMNWIYEEPPGDKSCATMPPTKQPKLTNSAQLISRGQALCGHVPVQLNITAMQHCGSD